MTGRPQPITLADALEEAQRRIADLLQHPDDLTSKVSQLKAKFQSEKASIDAILKTSVQSQLDDIQDGLQLLKSAQTTVAAVKSNLGTINEISLDPKSSISNYTKIRKVSRTHQNFIATRDVVNRFQALNKDIENISNLLAEHASNLLGDAPQLLFIHIEVYRLEEFKDHTVLKAKKQGPEVLQIVTKYFRKLDALSEKFREYLWDLAKNLLRLIQENQGGVVVRLLKVIEAEERADERVLANEQIRSSNPELRESSEWRVMEENPRTIKNYRSQLFNAVHESIEANFKQRISQVEEDVGAALETCRFVFEDLLMAFEELVPRFPPKYQIFHFFVIQYHRQVYDLLNRLSSRSLETRDILLMTSWVRDYYSLMAERFGVTEEELEPRLLDDNEDALIREYVRLIKTKLDEWVSRLLETEEQEFLTRDKPPETDTDGMFCTSAPVILFQMINQQIDIAIEASKGGRLLLDVVKECFSMFRKFQDTQLKMLESQEAKFLHGNEEIAAGFPEYVVSLSNNHLKCTEYVEQIQKRLETVLDEKYRGESSKYSNETHEAFMKVAKRGNQCLLAIIFRDISPAFTQFFTSAWYDKRSMSLILTTIEDYLQDFKKHLQDYLFSKLTTECMERFISCYLDAFKSKQAKFKMPQAKDYALDDLKQAEAFWVGYKTEKRVKQSFDIVTKVIGLLECSGEMIFLSWYALWKTYNDVPMQFVEDVLYKRDDLEKASIKEGIASCKAKAKEGNPEAIASAFSKQTDHK